MRLCLLVFVFVASPALAKTTHLHLETEISEETVSPLIEALESAPHDKNDVVVIEINSPGGEIDSGFRLTKAIERYPARVVCIVDGEADSMASYVLMACDQRVMTRRSILMIHEPAIGAEGHMHASEWRNIVDWLVAGKTALFSHYANHMHVSETELANRCSGGRELWMDWHDAQKYGAVDIVVDRVDDLKGVH